MDLFFAPSAARHPQSREANHTDLQIARKSQETTAKAPTPTRERRQSSQPGLESLGTQDQTKKRKKYVSGAASQPCTVKKANLVKTR